MDLVIPLAANDAETDAAARADSLLFIGNATMLIRVDGFTNLSRRRELPGIELCPGHVVTPR